MSVCGRVVDSSWEYRSLSSRKHSGKVQLRCVKLAFALGASIYDVRIEGGGGVSPKEDVVREVA